MRLSRYCYKNSLSLKTISLVVPLFPFVVSLLSLSVRLTGIKLKKTLTKELSYSKHFEVKLRLRSYFYNLRLNYILKKHMFLILAQI